MQPCKLSSAFIHCVHIHAVVPWEIGVAVVENRCFLDDLYIYIGCNSDQFTEHLMFPMMRSQPELRLAFMLSERSVQSYIFPMYGEKTKVSYIGSHTMLMWNSSLR